MGVVVEPLVEARMVLVAEDIARLVRALGVPPEPSVLVPLIPAVVDPEDEAAHMAAGPPHLVVSQHVLRAPPMSPGVGHEPGVPRLAHAIIASRRRMPPTISKRLCIDFNLTIEDIVIPEGDAHSLSIDRINHNKGMSRAMCASFPIGPIY